MRALGSAFQVVLDHLTHPVSHVTVLFVQGGSGCCLCVHHYLCACLMVRAMMRVVHLRASGTMGVARLIICLFVVRLTHLQWHRRLLDRCLITRHY